MSETYKGWANYETRLANYYLQGQVDDGQGTRDYVKWLITQSIKQADKKCMRSNSTRKKKNNISCGLLRC